MCLAICLCMKRNFLDVLEHNKQNNGIELNRVYCAARRLACWALARLAHTSPERPNTLACPCTVLRVRAKPAQMWMSIIMSPTYWYLQSDWIISSAFCREQQIRTGS